MVPPAPIQQILSEIAEAYKVFEDSGTIEESARKKALTAARDLVNALERPSEMIYQHAFYGPDRPCVRMAINLRIFHYLTAREPRSVSAQEITVLSGAEHSFIVRIMRVLITSNFVGEAGEELYTAIPATKAMTAPAIEAAVIHTFDHAFQVFPKMPAYFEKYGYKCPEDPKNTPFQFAFGTKHGFFEYLEQDPEVSKYFDTFMTASKLDRPLWEQWFPVQERIINNFHQQKIGNDVLLVDIGGGQGHDIERFKKRFPQASGRLILQDLGRVISKASVSPEIEAIPYDFFTPQPVKGARAYYFHHILHNWPDRKAKEILLNTVSAMTPGFSKLILNEYIIPATDCLRTQSWSDIYMMAHFAGCERTEKQFRQLLASVGLKEVSFWYPSETLNGVVEATLDAATLT